MDPENDSGNLEYKLKLVSISNDRFNELSTQMKYRLDEGDNECIYKIGINDNGSIQGLSRSEYNTTYENIRSIVKNVNASIINHNMKEFEKNLFIGDILIRKNDLSLPNEITLPVIIKADVQGSAEAIENSITKLSTEEVKTQVIHKGVGAITESDVALANSGKGFIVGFNVRAIPQARDMAKRDGVNIQYYSIIYELIDDIKNLMSGLLDPDISEKITGNVEIR